MIILHIVFSDWTINSKNRTASPSLYCLPNSLDKHFPHSENESHSIMFDSFWPHGLYSSWNSLGQNTGVVSLSLLQGIFPTQRSNPGLPHCRQILYQLSRKESPRILEWVAFPFSSRSSQPRNWTRVSCIASDSIPTELSGKPLHIGDTQ